MGRSECGSQRTSSQCMAIPTRKEKGKRQQRGQDGIEMKAFVELVSEIGAQHHEAGVGQVDDLHHPVDDGHAHRHHGVNAGQQQRGDEQVEEIDEVIRPGSRA